MELHETGRSLKSAIGNRLRQLAIKIPLPLPPQSLVLCPKPDNASPACIELGYNEVKSKSNIRILVLAFTVLAIVLPAVEIIQAQSPRTSKADEGTVESHVKPTTLIRKRKVDSNTNAESTTASFGNPAPAASRNVLLQTELVWEFGRKPQRGWQLYLPLIQRSVETEDSVGSDRFASALARWQAKSGLTPSGVLDEDSLYKMISEWQGARLKQRDYPEQDQLITAPASDFYHPSRPEELRQIERQTYAAYKRLVTAALSDPSLKLSRGADGGLAPGEKYLKILSSFRTREYQEYLRRQSPNAGRAGLAVNSPHFTGQALDLYVGGEPVDTSDANRALQIQSRVYLWLVRNAERFGFRPYFYEPWHWEYVGN